MSVRRYAIVAALALLAGCSKLTVENYDRLKPGMTFAEVKALLGDPARCDDVVGLRTCVWGDEARHIQVTFAADRVVVFAAKGIR